jgi:hypothetical protein
MTAEKDLMVGYINRKLELMFIATNWQSNWHVTKMWKALT